jgi:hypothetical protein
MLHGRAISWQQFEITHVFVGDGLSSSPEKKVNVGGEPS